MSSAKKQVMAGRTVAEPWDRRICVVDDDPWVRDSLTTLLETHGFEVLAYNSGAEFLADGPRRAGCLVIDLHMPGTDGLGTLAALRSEQSTIPAILVTGRLDATAAVRAAALRSVTILEKPFRMAQLMELIRANLDHPR